MLARLLWWILSKLGRDSRGLFLFYDGRRWRHVDGLETLRQFFMLKDFDWDNDPNMLRQPVATVQLAASKKVADATRRVFGILPVDMGGLSESRCLDLFEEFRMYCDDVKKNGKLFPISQELTEASGQLSESEIPPNPSLVSTSTSTVPSQEPAGLPAEETRGVLMS